MTQSKIQTPADTVTISILKIENGDLEEKLDEVAAEEPMETRVVVEKNGQMRRHSIAVTMRTPGHDFELAAGFLFSEGIIADRAAIVDIKYCMATSDFEQHNIVNVFLKPGVPFDPEKFSRNVYTTSSCGICGKTSLEMVQIACPALPEGTLHLDSAYFLKLPVKFQKAQTLFSRTGGLHASALFSVEGELLLMREDVGRHNAMDKMLGALFLEGRLPASDKVLLVSGRASYELVQKALMGGLTAMAAVGAPSSLAIDLAREFNMTLIGFLGKGRFNVYAGAKRINLGSAADCS
ncbi:formate dehydrogenase accessory sulfurtransferase FdhD [Acidobacteria bacterium AH-259-D05]|nr:formate dehydrogenase accessory sulfurtransferase FdhD [Acidobacteria bacterium AH-259-D05]